MADGATPTLSPKEAIALGRRYFDEMMEGQEGDRVLLEGLNLSDETGDWIVTFGFDSHRQKPKRSVPIGSFVKPMDDIRQAFEVRDFELIREFRAVHISATDGRFIKLAQA